MPYAPTLGDNADITEYRNALRGAADYLHGLRQTPADQRDAATFGDDVRGVVDFIHEADATLSALERSVPPAATGPAAATGATGERSQTPGEQFTAAEIYENHRGQWGAGHAEHEIRGSLVTREMRALIEGGPVTIDVDGGGVWRPLGTPVAPLVRQQRLFIRDVLNVIPTGLVGAIPYIRELNVAANETGATAFAEGTAKAEVTMQFEPALAPIINIAAWVPVTTQIIEDAPTLQGYINTRLTYMLALREEAQVLNGPGTGANMTGIRHTVGLQTEAAQSDYQATIGLSIAKVENVDGEADFVATNPTDFWTAVITRHATQLDSGWGGNAPAELQAPTWGRPVIRTRSMEAGKALVGSAMGASIADRMTTTIRVGNQHSDFFTTNKVAVLAEERVGLLVHRPDLFVEASVP